MADLKPTESAVEGTDALCAAFTGAVAALEPLAPEYRVRTIKAVCVILGIGPEELE